MTFPSRALGAGGERHYFDYVRTAVSSGRRGINLPKILRVPPKTAPRALPRSRRRYRRYTKFVWGGSHFLLTISDGSLTVPANLSAKGRHDP